MHKDVKSNPLRWVIHSGERDAFARDALGLLKNLRHSIRRGVDAEMAKCGLTEAQWEPLLVMATTAVRTAGELAREMNVDASAVTRLLDRLAEKGLVRRTRSLRDRRILNLELTVNGVEVAGRIPMALVAIKDELLCGFSEQEIGALLSMLRRMLANAGALAQSGRLSAPNHNLNRLNIEPEVETDFERVGRGYL
jgi:DNA-binding MarR family transcriptional regulator